MGSKKPPTTTTTTAPDPTAMAAYRDILSRAQTVSQTPYEAYTGDRVAGFSPDQMAAFQATRNAQGVATPFLTEATGLARAGAAPIDAAAIERYQNPYQQSVIDKTMADLQTQNAIAQQQVTGNAALRGALGGSRVGVAQALTAGEQARAQAPIIANLYSSGYDKALAAAQQDRAASSAGASLMAGLGDASSTSAYRDIASLYGMGQQQQANQQAGLDAAYQEWLTKQAYPTQQLSWLSDITGRTGGAMGGTSTQVAPAPNPWNSVLGAAATAAGAYFGLPPAATSAMTSSLTGSNQPAGGSMNTKPFGFAAGGVVPGYEDGGIIDFTRAEDGAYALPDVGSEPMSAMGTGGGPAASGPFGIDTTKLANPLMQAGFAMMASPSPYLGQAIGQGGLAGTKAYTDQEKAAAERKYKEDALQVQRERLAASLKAQRERLASENWQYLGQTPDGAAFVDRKSGETVIKPLTIAPRTGTGSPGGQYEFRRQAYLRLYPTDEAGALEYAAGRKFVSAAEAAIRARSLASSEARSQGLTGKEMEDYVERTAAAYQRAFMDAGARAPLVTPPPVAAPSPSAPPAPAPMAPSAAPAPAPSAPPTTFRDPYDVGPGSPPIRAPLPPSPAAPAPAPAIRFSAPGLTVPPRPAGMSDADIRASARDSIKAYPATEPMIRARMKAWGISLD